MSTNLDNISWFTLGILDYIDMFEGTMNAGLKTFIIDTYKAQVEKLKELQDPKTGLCIRFSQTRTAMWKP